MFSVFDLFKIGIGPSSSHTVGPMKATADFVDRLQRNPSSIDQCNEVCVELFGSLALTGRGHATDRAVVLGLSGFLPESVPAEVVSELPDHIQQTKILKLGIGRQLQSPIEMRAATVGEASDHADVNLVRQIPWVDGTHLVWHTDRALPRHPNALRVSAFDRHHSLLLEETYYSVGGGFVIRESDAKNDRSNSEAEQPLKYPFTTAEELLRICDTHRLKIWQVVLKNELCWKTKPEIDAGIARLWNTMRESIERGCHTEGELPGGLHVRRRAAGIRQQLLEREACDGLEAIDWLSSFAMAVNEENAAGHRVVTAPTNGAAGVIPAVIAYYEKFFEDASKEGIQRFLLTATAIGSLYKHNASLSAAEVGCQGEVGVASSMAAAGLAEVMGGTNRQIENAAEIAMEHHLGMTCDPIGGLVQVPCIERNAVGAVKAVNAARLAVRFGDGTHQVALDRAIETMRQTGIDMANKYKETSLGGLAVNVGIPEC